MRLADTHLVLGQRLIEWVGHAPTLEEELALGNIALDLIGVAKTLFEHVAAVEGKRRSADQLAFLRHPHEFRNVLLAEQPNGDFAQTIARQLLISAWMTGVWSALENSADEIVKGTAAKAGRETAYHLDHARAWLVRLGDGTEESHRRAAAALELLSPYVDELFEMDDLDRRVAAAGVGADFSALRPEFDRRVGAAVSEATLKLPEASSHQSGGRQGLHSEHLGHLLATMQVLQRSYPGLEW